MDKHSSNKSNQNNDTMLKEKTNQDYNKQNQIPKIQIRRKIIRQVRMRKENSKNVPCDPLRRVLPKRVNSGKMVTRILMIMNIQIVHQTGKEISMVSKAKISSKNMLQKKKGIKFFTR